MSVGSNMGDRLQHLRSVAESLGARVVSRSSVYVTAPWGDTDQEDFYNTILIAECPTWDMWSWLEFAQRCERRAERVRERHWGPRTLDVDIVSCSDAGEQLTSSDPKLTLPHPRAHERAFVLVPWLEAEPAATLLGVPLSEHLDALPRGERAGVRRLDDQAEWFV
nr:2-amino-4-hydroxy-6-hydroxymethyldihydropteridine diphosphokinase [Hoyosella altamirensis]